MDYGDLRMWTELEAADIIKVIDEAIEDGKFEAFSDLYHATDFSRYHNGETDLEGVLYDDLTDKELFEESRKVVLDAHHYKRRNLEELQRIIMHCTDPVHARNMIIEFNGQQHMTPVQIIVHMEKFQMLCLEAIHRKFELEDMFYPIITN